MQSKHTAISGDLEAAFSTLLNEDGDAAARNCVSNIESVCTVCIRIVACALLIRRLLWNVCKNEFQPQVTPFFYSDNGVGYSLSTTF
jgi:hypothetical protein